VATDCPEIVPPSKVAQRTSGFDPRLRWAYRRLRLRKGAALAKVPVARMLALRPHIMLRD